MSYWRSLEFLAWLYTHSPVTKTVLTNDRWGRGTQCHHGDFFTCGDRNNPRKLLKHKWENALTLDRSVLKRSRNKQSSIRQFFLYQHSCEI